MFCGWPITSTFECSLAYSCWSTILIQQASLLKEVSTNSELFSPLQPLLLLLEHGAQSYEASKKYQDDVNNTNLYFNENYNSLFKTDDSATWVGWCFTYILCETDRSKTCPDSKVTQESIMEVWRSQSHILGWGSWGGVVGSPWSIIYHIMCRNIRLSSYISVHCPKWWFFINWKICVYKIKITRIIRSACDTRLRLLKFYDQRPQLSNPDLRPSIFKADWRLCKVRFDDFNYNYSLSNFGFIH